MPLCKQCSLPYPSGDTDAENKSDFCSQPCQDRWYQKLVEVNNAINQNLTKESDTISGFDVSGYNWNH